MKKADCFDFDKYREYLKFLEECKTKNYDSKLVLHKHHIIPKHICADELLLNSDENIVKLSVEDHAKAHLLFAEMYEVGTYEHSSNLRSARIIGKKSIRDVDTLEKISKTYVGDKNPFYGKTHSEEVRKVLSEKSNLHRVGKTYEEIYGKERADEEKRKRAKKTRTDDEYKEAGKNISKSLKGKYLGDNNPLAQPYLVDGVYFGSKRSVQEYYGNCFITIKKYHKVEKIDRKRKHEYID
jgi:hypothetical protein